MEHSPGELLLHVAVVSHRDDGDTVGLGDERQRLDETVFDGLDGSDLRGALYRFGLREYGRCVGKCFHDTADGTVHTGYVFQRRTPYEDDPSESSLIETWISIERVTASAQPTIVEAVALG